VSGGCALSAKSEPLLQTTLLGDAVEHAPVGVFVFDDRGNYVAANHSACELLGYPREELLDLRIGDLAPSREDALRGYLEALRNGSTGRTTARRKDGVSIELNFRSRETRMAGMSFYIGVAWPVD
jgi:PAS domain S-box-containing protein